MNSIGMSSFKIFSRESGEDSREEMLEFLLKVIFDDK